MENDFCFKPRAFYLQNEQSFALGDLLCFLRMRIVDMSGADHCPAFAVPMLFMKLCNTSM